MFAGIAGDSQGFRKAPQAPPGTGLQGETVAETHPGATELGRTSLGNWRLQCFFFLKDSKGELACHGETLQK